MAKRINRNGRPAVLHFITINVRDRKCPFRHDAYARAVLQALRKHCDEHPARLIAYVAIPDHLHAILNPRDGDINMLLSQFKPSATNALAIIAQQQGQQAVLDWLTMHDGSRQLWQESKHNLHLYSDWMIWQKINYIHNNPIRAGLVTHAAEYPYSSFQAFYGVGEQAIVPIDAWWWEDLPLDLEGD